MKYYQVSISAEPEIIGVNNGIYQLEVDEKAIEYSKDYDEFKAHFNYNNKEFWNNQNKVKTLTPPTIKGKMLKKAKVTDIMGYAPEFSFLSNIYSEKYISILKSFNINAYTIFDFEIENIIEKYYLMFIETIILEEVNFNKSIVTTGYKVTNNLRYHIVNNLSEYKEFRQKNVISTFEKLAIPKKYCGRDVIETQAAVHPFYSEKLIDFLLDCGITGLQVSYNNSIELDFV